MNWVRPGTPRPNFQDLLFLGEEAIEEITEHIPPPKQKQPLNKMTTIVPSAEIMDEEIPMELSSDESEITDTEEALKNLDNYSNLTQLLLLKSEIDHIVSHNCLPKEDWYNERIKYIRIYSQLNWNDLIQTFYGKDNYMFQMSMKIKNTCEVLLEEASTKPIFNLQLYYNLIHDIHSIWHHYFMKYMGEETDPDMIDLISNMTHMRT